MLIQVQCDLEMKPRTGQLSSEVSDADTVVGSDASFQKLTAHVLQVRQQQEVGCLQDVLDVFCRQPNLRGVDVIHDALERARVDTEVDASLSLVFWETAVIAEQSPRIERPALSNNNNNNEEL